MQMIEAVIKPQKLDAVKSGLAKLGILGVTAVECKGFGRQMGHTERYRGAKMDVGFVPKVLLKICVKGDETKKAVEAIIEVSKTYPAKDMFVISLEKVCDPTVRGIRSRSNYYCASVEKIVISHYQKGIRCGEPRLLHTA